MFAVVQKIIMVKFHLHYGLHQKYQIVFKSCEILNFIAFTRACSYKKVQMKLYFVNIYVLLHFKYAEMCNIVYKYY